MELLRHDQFFTTDAVSILAGQYDIFVAILCKARHQPPPLWIEATPYRDGDALVLEIRAPACAQQEEMRDVPCLVQWRNYFDSFISFLSCLLAASAASII